MGRWLKLKMKVIQSFDPNIEVEKLNVKAKQLHGFPTSNLHFSYHTSTNFIFNRKEILII